MKKLMIACAAVAMAAAAQAASMDWSIPASAWYEKNGTTKGSEGWTIYLVDAKQASTVIAAIDATTGALNTEDATWYFGQQTSGSKGKVVKDQAGNPVTTTSANLTAGKPYDFAALIIDARDAANGNIYYMLSGSDGNTAYTIGSDEPVSVSFVAGKWGTGAASYDATNGLNGWASVSVPEPTSGLLLLLGVAGLALKRRRA